MAKLFVVILLVLVVAQSQQTSAIYVIGTQNDQEDGASAMDVAEVKPPQVVLSEPDKDSEEYIFSYSQSEPMGDGQQHDMNRLLRLQKITGLKPVQLKRLFVAGNRQPFIEMDDPFTKVLGFNKWGADARLEGSDNHLSSKKAARYPLNAGLRKLFDTNKQQLVARKKKSRCVADDSRGVKNPSFCDMDAYFGAAGYRSDLWDSAGRR